MGKKIVVVGAGYAGILTAKKLAKRFKKINSDVNITIIDKNPFHTMLTELHEVAANRVDEDSIKISLKKVFAGRKVDVKLDTVNSIDFDNKQVIGSNENYEYDYLVLAAGSKPTDFGIKGVKEHAFMLWSYEDAVKLKDHIHDMFRKAACETNLEEKKRLLTFHVIGAGFTGVEMVGELAEYVPILCEKYEIERSLVTLVNADGLSRTVPNLDETLSRKVEKRLIKMGVDLLLNNFVQEVGPDYVITKNGDTVTKHITGTVIWAAGIEGSEITTAVTKQLQGGGRGRVKVDQFLRSLDDEHVFVVGDNMFYINEGEERPVPQVVENAEQSSETAAHNIVCAVTGNGEMNAYKHVNHGFMVCVGGRYGVASVGTPKRMFKLPSFLAMFTKHFINIVYFIQVLGWNKIFSYVKHEFFTIRNCRSFVGGHFSNRTPSFLLVPLRLWLGCIWVFEGVMKVVEGWFSSPKLTGFFGGANAWYNSIINPGAVDGVSGATGAAEAVVDTVTAATGAAGAAAEAIGTKILNFDFLGLFEVIFVSGKSIVESTISDFAFKLNVPLMNWFVDSFIMPSDKVQLFMQGFIVIAEILIGLALIGGLFTSVASFVSIVLQFMFVCTTGLYLNTFWMIFASIALLIGAGRTFGFDYYVMPYLKKKWKQIPFVRRLYIYND
ncbi:MAG: FAD-dependent oxidoreductase [Tissierellia bacterium]|nr:FAD-dependent oxidoreductase [Tissierellia bacterium]MDD4781171.1 FAD-dependent oxidoreductase [Tissierellia bacterium]